MTELARADGDRAASSGSGARRSHRKVSVAEALSIVRETARPVDRIERCPIVDATGRVLAAHVGATVDVPPFERAAMDGYAVKAADTAAASAGTPVILECLEQLFAGEVSATALRTQSCVAVATGAPMPAGADAVVMIERTRRSGRGVAVFEAATRGQHVAARGSDLEAGVLVARQGDELWPGRVAALAAVGVGEVEVFGRPRVAVVSTGSELLSPGDRLTPGRIYDVNRYSLASLVTAHGGVVGCSRTIADRDEELARVLAECRDDDLVVLSGGTSVGAHDLIVDAVSRLGTVLFAGIAVKPGKSTAFGVVDGRPLLALPGYPTACLLNAYVLLVPLLQRLARLSDRARRVVAPLARRVTSPPGTHHFSTVRLEDGGAVPVFKKAGDVTSVSEADGYIVLEADVDALDAGTLVEVTLFPR